MERFRNHAHLASNILHTKKPTNVTDAIERLTLV